MASEKGAFEQAADLTRSWIAYLNELRSAAPGIGWGIRATLSRSSGLYLLSMLSLSVALIAIRIVVAEIALDGRRVSALERLFDLRQEPMRNEDKPVLAATILGTAVDWTLCSAELRDPPVATPDGGTAPIASDLPSHIEIVRALDAAALLFVAQFSRSPSQDLVDRAKVTLGQWRGENRSAVELGGSLQQVLVHTDAAGRGYTMVYPGISIRVPTLAIPEWGAGPDAGVIHEEVTSASTLPTAADVVEVDAASDARPSSSGVPPVLLQRLRGAIRRPSNELLANFVGIVNSQRNDHAELRPQIQRFFFVSWNGVIQIYDERQHRMESVQGSHVFSNAGYVTAALRASSVRSSASLSGSTPASAIAREADSSASRCSIPSAFALTRSVSRVYLDLLGSGAVATVCYPVRSASESEIGGVFCADLSLPRRVIHGGAREGRGLTGLLVNTTRSTLSDDDEYQFRDLNGSPMDMDQCADDHANSVVPGRASCPGRAVRTWADRRRADRSAIDPIRGNSEVDDFVAITWKGRIGNHRLIDVTVATSPRSKTRLWLSMSVALGFGIVAVALVVVRRQQDDEQLRLAIIEGLHVGVLISCPEERRSRRAVEEGELAVLEEGFAGAAEHYRETRIESHDSRILSMNDRAEELFWKDRKPTWKSSETWWSSLIMRHPNDPSMLVCFDAEMRPISFGQIAKLRSRGETSSYYVAARYGGLEGRLPATWIRVTGSVALPSKTTFAVVEKVESPSLIRDLNYAFDKLGELRLHRLEFEL